MSTSLNSVFFKTSFRIATLVSGILFPLFFSFYSFQFDALRGFLISSVITVLVGVLIYSVSNYILAHRLHRLMQDIQRIRQKKFDAIDTVYDLRRDELDRIIKLNILTSQNIGKEIKRLKKIENYRKEFIGDVSHELKTPIFAVQGFLETLLDGALEDPEVNREFLKKAMRNVNRLIYLTNDLMEISKLETGELQINYEDFNLVTTVYEILENLQYKADQEKVRLELGPISEYIRVFADRHQFRQVLINLIENAIKYNKPDGKVTVGAKTYPQNSDKILVYVNDTGLGIEKKHLKRVTERFFRIDKSRSREKGGTGLGLSIVKHTIEAHGEHLFIESEAGVGSTFSFTVQNAEKNTASKLDK